MLYLFQFESVYGSQSFNDVEIVTATFQYSGSCFSGEPSLADQTTYHHWKKVCFNSINLSILYIGILFTKCIIPSCRWKRSVEENSEAWSLDLGLRMLAVKEVSCKRRLVRLNMSFIEEMKKKPTAYKQRGV